MRQGGMRMRYGMKWNGYDGRLQKSQWKALGEGKGRGRRRGEKERRKGRDDGVRQVMIEPDRKWD